VRALIRVSAAVVLGLAATGLSAVPAAGQFDPTPIDCEADPTAAQCQDDQPPPAEDDPPPGGGQACFFGDAAVPCNTAYGSWVGDAIDGDWYGINGDVWPALLVGCWATVTAADRDPPTSYPGDAPVGAWYTLSCLGPGGSWPTPGVTQFGLAWTPTADAAPDPEELARRALAQIGLVAPGFALSPPTTGTVPLGMPVWLAVPEDEASWGPVSSGPVCDQGLCVEVTATVERVRWQMGDGTEVVCTRGQNVAWRPGRDFLNPGAAGACHHFYEQPSRTQPDGRYRVTATTTWRAQWSGGGQSGVFDDVVDACGPGGDALCQSAAQVAVEELQVLGTR
jgi:hypothetical protein